MEFTKKAQDLKRGLPRFRHRLAERCRRLFAVVICASLVLSGFPSGFFQAFAADESGDYVFELDRTSIYEALDTAIADGMTLESELKFLGDHKEEYDELFEPDGTLYELEDLETDKDRERDKNVELRVFVRIEGDISLDEAYEADGTEEVLFLLSNKTDDEISVKIVLDDRETEVITIPAAKDIPVEVDNDLLDRELEEIPETVELEAAPGAGGGAEAGAAGDGTYIDDISEDEAADEETENADTEDSVGEGEEEAAGQNPAETDDTDDGSEEGDDSDDSDDYTDSSENDAVDQTDKQHRSDNDSDKDASDKTDDEGGKEKESDKDSRSDDKDSSSNKDSSKGKDDGDSSRDKDSSRGENSSRDKGSSDDKGSSSERGSSRSRGASERNSNSGNKKEEKTASISVNKIHLLAASIDFEAEAETEEEKAGTEEAVNSSLEEAVPEESDDSVVIVASPSNASPSNASPSDASKIIDGTVYDPVRLGNRGAVAFVTTTDDLGLNDDDIITTLTYEGEDYIVTVSYGRDANLPRDVELLVSEYEKDSDTFQERLAEVAEFNDWDESRFEERIVYDDENDDEGHAESIVDRIRLFNVSLNSDGTEVEPEAEVEVQIALLNSEEPGENGGCYSVFHFADTEIEAIDPTNEYEDEVQTITFLVSSFSDIMLLDDADPHFTVQFYANIDQILREHTGDDTDLTVIETHTDNGKELPGNNGSSASNYNTSVVELKSTGTNSFKLDSKTVLTEMYKAENYEFVLEPDLHSMNKLEVNSDYTLKQIWVLTGSDSTSMNESDWKTYDVTSTQDPSTGEYTYNISFTNNQSEASDNNTIYIAEGSVFRFVYDTTPSDAYITANFYDYNITDGEVYASRDMDSSGKPSGSKWTSGTKYYYTKESGINDSNNYSNYNSSEETKLAFGNNNAGSGLGTVYWGDNQPNKYNNNGLLGCTFTLTTGLDSDGYISYSSGINAPNLFNDGDATGKHTFSNAQLIFDREGDTYTLSGVRGDNISLSNLDTFNNPRTYTSIFTNNFWPLDNVSYDGMDPLFGEAGNDVQRFGEANGVLPESDDGLAHNSYFGMNFDVGFSYTNDYIGPLEYFFFGDDDMWVFLDGELVLDIGGVHSSVGEHVDLWDYLKSERDSLEDGETAYHTLSVFYTERGASGSTCFISYTLPTVSSVTPVDNSGSLRVDKQVIGNAAEEGKDFTFTIGLKDESGNTLTNVYNAIVYMDENEDYVDNSYLVTNESTLTLRDGWHFVIHNLPEGTIATITETAEDGYSTSWQVTSPTTGEVHNGNEASGDEIEIVNGGVTTILFINIALGYILPATGGGKYPFRIAGALLLISSVAMLYVLLRRRESVVRK